VHALVAVHHFGKVGIARHADQHVSVIAAHVLFAHQEIHHLAESPKRDAAAMLGAVRMGGKATLPRRFATFLCQTKWPPLCMLLPNKNIGGHAMLSRRDLLSSAASAALAYSVAPALAATPVPQPASTR
jgi:hypothetical protein